jgi:hypothetical protein
MATALSQKLPCLIPGVQSSTVTEIAHRFLVICPSGIDFARIAPTSRADRDVPRRPMADIGWKYRGVRVVPMKRHSIPQARTLLLEVAWGCAREKFAISASVDAAPVAVKAAQSSPVMLVSRLTIDVARKSLRAEPDTPESAKGGPFLRMQSVYVAVSIRWSCGWNSLHTKAQRLLGQLTSAT